MLAGMTETPPGAPASSPGATPPAAGATPPAAPAGDSGGPPDRAWGGIALDIAAIFAGIVLVVACADILLDGRISRPVRRVLRGDPGDGPADADR